MGDPSGIGPEIIVKALGNPGVQRAGPFLLIGSRILFEKEMDRLKVPLDVIGEGLPFQQDLAASRKFSCQEGISILDPYPLRARLLGKRGPSKESGKASLAYIEAGIDLALKGAADALVTAPVSKKAFAMAGSPFRGHTEILAQRTNAVHPVMMFAGSGLRISLVTAHLPLKEVPRALSQEKIFHTLRITALALSRFFKIRDPLLGVLSLNPHSGEGGILGREELEIILPALGKARRRGIRFEGPLPGDTAFLPEMRRKFHAYVAMYHDQALVPVKMLLFRKSVHITLGLPIVRTSVDHGTAFDLAGQGKADPGSLVQAIQMARRLANRRKGEW